MDRKALKTGENTEFSGKIFGEWTFERLESEFGVKGRRALFCVKMVELEVGCKAVVAAGYSETSAEQQAAELLKKPNISEAIKALRASKSENVAAAVGISVERCLTELGRMAFYDPAAVASGNLKGPEDIASLPEDVRRCIIGWSWDQAGNFCVKMTEKTPQINLLLKHLGALTEKISAKVEHSGAVSNTVMVVRDVGDDEAWARKLLEQQNKLQDGNG